MSIPVYIQPPNKPQLQEYVCDVEDDDGPRDVLRAVGLTMLASIDIKRIRGKNPRWSVVVIGTH